MRNFILYAFFAAFLMGCAGTKFSYDNARQVEVGMTEAQLTNMMGRPHTVVSRGDEQMWVWSYANAFGGAKSVSFKVKDGVVVEVPTIPASFK